MPKVVIQNEKREIEVPIGGNLRREARKAGVQVYPKFNRIVNCHGLGLCGTCRVLVKNGMENLSPKATWEKIRLAVSKVSIGHENEMRLSCQTQVNGDCEIVTQPAKNMEGDNFWQKPWPNK